MDWDMLHKAIVGRWLAAFWGGQDLALIDELAVWSTQRQAQMRILAGGLLV